jgi:predicted HAD superfamily Cof-like phosphohydrolase
MKHIDQADEFRYAVGQPVGNASINDMNLQWDLIVEEYEELQDEDLGPSVAELKELCDLVYVCYQYASAIGYDLDEALNRVHASNMSKLVHGVAIKDGNGKVLKGPNYQPPNLEDLI